MAGRGRPPVDNPKRTVVSFKIDRDMRWELGQVIADEGDADKPESLNQAARSMLERALRERVDRLRRPYGRPLKKGGKKKTKKTGGRR